ncbi:hypothetical protein IEQ34_021310 [Dendrobium chrysotoxum]|uniref:Uncharacterized protein n=1 Tax=Dendrobium chrysotoxum TaxID=161865 RepID=A0AAV7G5I7_DENCH|nr:hypothetical protein IEQ34_021310 [Dendrobium chrysotoxum]
MSLKNSINRTLFPLEKGGSKPREKAKEEEGAPNPKEKRERSEIALASLLLLDHHQSSIGPPLDAMSLDGPLPGVLSFTGPPLDALSPAGSPLKAQTSAEPPPESRTSAGPPPYIYGFFDPRLQNGPSDLPSRGFTSKAVHSLFSASIPVIFFGVRVLRFGSQSYPCRYYGDGGSDALCGFTVLPVPSRGRIHSNSCSDATEVNLGWLSSSLKCWSLRPLASYTHFQCKFDKGKWKANAEKGLNYGKTLETNNLKSKPFTTNFGGNLDEERNYFANNASSESYPTVFYSIVQDLSNDGRHPMSMVGYALGLVDLGLLAWVLWWWLIFGWELILEFYFCMVECDFSFPLAAFSFSPLLPPRFLLLSLRFWWFYFCFPYGFAGFVACCLGCWSAPSVPSQLAGSVACCLGCWSAPSVPSQLAGFVACCLGCWSAPSVPSQLAGSVPFSWLVAVDFCPDSCAELYGCCLVTFGLSFP